MLLSTIHELSRFSDNIAWPKLRMKNSSILKAPMRNGMLFITFPSLPVRLNSFIQQGLKMLKMACI